ncbi:hypothetical protein STPYR_11968 [uncultured Stenotrophomonas sp.]|uniref:Uncharacterized protein n=1 Tax=uncultured Stenotrophomonas sp. TaxID=165438 RepID=A0A1Y5Q407_9GAMM|nr:hypothetical protein STPYR_11968 [uncultured Stenotrophomonas sp.]
MSERSELCAVPSFREERREPMRRSRIGSRPAVLTSHSAVEKRFSWLPSLCTSKEK